MISKQLGGFAQLSLLLQQVFFHGFSLGGRNDHIPPARPACARQGAMKRDGIEVLHVRLDLIDG